jgi:hypothetical protein
LSLSLFLGGILDICVLILNSYSNLKKKYYRQI